MNSPADIPSLDPGHPLHPHPHGRRLLLVVIDGLGADSLRRAVESGHAPNVAALLDAGARFDDAISPFPSLTPVCLASIVTGVGPDQHRIPSLGWYSRGRGRFVEYGSSFSASTVEGTRRQIEDVMVDLNHVHLAEEPRTIFELVQDNGMRAASINYLIFRGRTRHTMKHDYAPLRAATRRAGVHHVHSVYGPDHFYFGELYGSSRPLLPQVGVKRPLDWGGGRIARWLMRNTGVDFVLLYLGQHDAKSHKLGPDGTQEAIRVADKALGRAIGTFGGLEEFLAKFAVMLCADHGQTKVDHHASLEDVFDDVALFRGSRGHDAASSELAVVGSNRVAMIYRTKQAHHRAGSHDHRRAASPDNRWIAQRAGESPGSDVMVFEEEGMLVALGANGGELRARRDPERGTPTVRSAATGELDDRWHVEGDLELLGIERSDGVLGYGDYPDALHRIASAIGCINTGDVLVSAAPGYEFTDIGGSAHPGGSHGSLHVADSTAPLLTIGLEGNQPMVTPCQRLSDIAPMVAAHLAIDTPVRTPHAAVASSG